MGQIKWYKRDPSAALGGMMGLSLEDRGAYNTVLDLIYSRDGNLPDDDRFIAGWMGVDVRVWRRIKQRLIDLGKLYIADGIVRNERADVEVLSALSRVGSARDAGKASGNARRYKSNQQSRENNDLERTDDPTDRERNLELTTTTPRIEEEAKASPSARARAKPPRSTGVDIPLPDDWIPNLGPAAQAIVDRWPPGLLERDELAFRSHAKANGRLAKDWDAAFRTWITKTEQRRIDHGQHRQNAQPDRRDGAIKALDRIIDQGDFGESASDARRRDLGGGGEVLPLALPAARAVRG